MFHFHSKSAGIPVIERYNKAFDKNIGYTNIKNTLFPIKTGLLKFPLMITMLHIFQINCLSCSFINVNNVTVIMVNNTILMRNFTYEKFSL